MFDFIYKYEDKASLLICFLVGLIIYKRLQKSEQRILVFVLISALVSLLSYYTSQIQRKNNTYLYHAFSQIELAFFLSYLYLNNHVKKIHATKIFFAYLSFGIVNIFYIDTIYKYNSIGVAISQILILCLCLNSILHLAIDDNQLLFYKQPKFWIILGFLMFAVMGTMIAVMINSVSLELF